MTSNLFAKTIKSNFKVNVFLKDGMIINFNQMLNLIVLNKEFCDFKEDI
tara:strand:- start:150 stop:296 length:147 start_codon:yes stop_codon:yes gene_type:complete